MTYRASSSDPRQSVENINKLFRNLLLARAHTYEISARHRVFHDENSSNEYAGHMIRQ